MDIEIKQSKTHHKIVKCSDFFLVHFPVKLEKRIVGLDMRMLRFAIAGNNFDRNVTLLIRRKYLIDAGSTRSTKLVLKNIV